MTVAYFLKTMLVNALAITVAVPTLVVAEVARRADLALPRPWGYGPKGRSGDVNP